MSDENAGALARYLDPSTDAIVEAAITGPEDAAAVVSAALALSSGRGHPAIDFQRGDGSSLTYASDGDRTLLVWTDSLGESFHSVGGPDGERLIFDYFGSWSESPSKHTVGAHAALACVVTYLREGVTGTDVLFEPD